MTLSATILAAHVKLPLARCPIRGRRRALGGPDEDVLTLAFEAAEPLLFELSAPPRALVVASVSRPLDEGGMAATLAECLGLSDVHVEDHAGTTAAGATALTSAIALANNGLEPVLFVAGDCGRKVDDERLGDGAVAAILTSSGSGLGLIQFLGSRAQAHNDIWRPLGSPTLHVGDRSLTAFVAERDQAPWAQGLSSDLVGGTASRPIDRVGSIGCGDPLLRALLRLADDATAPVDFGAIAGGVACAHRWLPTPTARAAGLRARDAVAGGIDLEEPPPEPAPPIRSYDSLARAWRDRGSILRREGKKLEMTGEICYPASQRDFGRPTIDHKVSRRGRVYTCTTDYIFDTAPTVLAVVELDDGGRFFGQVLSGETVEIGDEVELVLRRLYVTDRGIPRYFWKISPHVSAEASHAH